VKWLIVTMYLQYKVSEFEPNLLCCGENSPLKPKLEFENETLTCIFVDIPFPGGPGGMLSICTSSHDVK